MSPTEVIAQAAGDGVLIAFSPTGSISAKGSQSAIDRWLPAIRENKDAIIGLLRPDKDGWSPWDWRLFFDERAGIAEFDGGLSPAEAEARAFSCCLAEWLNRNPQHSPPGCCFRCGGFESSCDRLLPMGIGSAGRVWLHSRCGAAWYAGRKAEAVAALTMMGVTTPANLQEDLEQNRSARRTEVKRWDAGRTASGYASSL
jgi:hypothetical protein